MHRDVIEITVDKIIPNTYQPRKSFNKEALEELSESMKTYGIIQPLTVRKRGEVFELVAGERRLRAAKIADLTTVPCTVVDITDSQSAQVALLENLQRENLNFIEEAEAYYNLIQDHHLTQEQLALRLGKKQSTIVNKLRLLKLSLEVRKLCLDNNLSERHAKAVLSLPTEKLQLKILRKVIKEGINIKNTDMLVNKEILKLNGKQLVKDERRKITGVFSAKIYVNSIKQMFDKFKIPAEYKSKDCGEYVQIIVNIPKINMR
ncbi:nucleoid occlusion protein [Clostridium polyendosporum]|uniref:Nucleoid occlusion protein n=1 Tax=Clostridium polyendosporum TaxID=69208 RepID=A0A919S0M5_9CLOT|nr:ParB/RepB/Spo0J family partition protein [Clostridium polyendosporum]GIM28975.1 nucleoid occlusion protein [Clostridium polyendosporum]